MEANSENSILDDGPMVDPEDTKFSNSKLFRKDDMGDFHVIDGEEIMEAFSQYIHLGAGNPYGLMMDRAGFLKRHGLTPVFMVDQSGTRLVVTSDEHIRLKLH